MWCNKSWALKIWKNIFGNAKENLGFESKYAPYNIADKYY